MKIIYPHLQKLLPKLRANPKDTGNQLTMIGHFMDGFTVIKNEPVISLEVRQNRGDALSYYGIAKELSVLHQIPVRTPTTSLPQSTENFNLPIEIKAVKDVKRVLALRISNVSVKDSPAWLREFLEKHEINSINNIVDLTNYIMLFYGIPCHAFDTAITGNNLIWENNNKYKEFTTLDGSVLKLDNNMLIVSNEHEPLSISFIGGQNSGIKPTTSEIIIEMAVYNRSRVRNDSRKLKTITEASIRLD
jgi:phenylalanyl-tRNA synthetase beta chain